MKRAFLIFGSIYLFISVLAIAQDPLSRIAFGSCSEEDKAEQMWADILLQKPQLCIWLGDNIYADTHDMNFLRSQYQKQKSNIDYQKLLKSCSVIGTWDDHDYGVNDGGKFYTKKKESKEEMLSFFDVPSDASIRNHEGVYNSYIYGAAARKVKIILLDTRYFRDTLYKSNEGISRYRPNTSGDILGEAQWVWLEKELTESDAALNIIGSSIQFVADEHGYEKWANFPASRERLIQILSRAKSSNTFIISGDRHIAEISKMKVPGWDHELYDFTSSGLTHTWTDHGMKTEINHYRVGDLIIQKNFGMILIDWSETQPKVRLQIRGHNNSMYEEQLLDFPSTR